ncbi:transcription/translation regulatory transformer protein RfaH [Herbaspirillum robiniae]|uniref:Transcription antitermination protein RfaH n=1 Tax=Herbaspirillum robiniae TaxID=2014887 RepID=A0A246WM02_9BURK|nr:transcription/translation regulatory transformer protein RfaH [Herbaspirillum robiniae]OWY27308.1 transcription/translation regulatory transformer protein RfaH [Herbaspirillum robiniae]
MHWYLVHTKPRQEKCAQENLERQGFQCYLPVLPVEKLRQGTVTVSDEPLFPRYLFIRLGRDSSTKSWTPIRSTKGVSRLVSFGTEPAKVDSYLIELLQQQQSLVQHEAQQLFSHGEKIQLRDGPFAGLEGIYQMADGDRRVIVLIELLSKPVVIPVRLTSVRKLS